MIENKTYVFNGSSTTLLTWFTSSRLLESPYTDLTSNPAPFHLDWWLNYDGSSTQYALLRHYSTLLTYSQYLINYACISLD